MPGFTRPGRALIGRMVVLTTIWLMFALALNWGGASASLFYVFAGSSEAILRGEVWRLFTAPLLHTPTSVGHLLWSVLGLVFFAPRLEELWGSARVMRFIGLSCVLAYLLQMAFELHLPATLAARLVGRHWYGLQPAIAAITIAWACTFKGETVKLFLLPPMSSRTLILIVIGLDVLRLAAAQNPEEGLLSPFSGTLFGWLLGGGTPSPLRKAWLKLRLAQLQSGGPRGRDGRGVRKARPNPGGLRVIPGGRADDDDDKGPDGRWLN